MKTRLHHVQQHRLAMPGLEAISLATDQRFPRHSHDQFGIGIFTQGAQYSWSHLGKIEAVAGNIIMVNPGEMHDGIPLDGPRSWQMVYLDPERVVDELQGEMKAEEILLRPVVEDPMLRGQMQRLFREIVASAPDDAAVEEALLLCLMQVCQFHLCARRPGKIGSPAIVLARQYLDDAPEEKISLEALARLCGLSRFQLIRGFARATGITPHAYLIQSRVRLARRLLMEGHSLADTAFMAGFADQSHLTRAFQKQFAVTPGSYQAIVQASR
ncbi:TPA: AraC family transcriptional regulator [Klebsiella oxytoca]|uniref:helix-turn-helix transcriptional regulator n=1 Tax=Klebsiella oxytoca TaxID=571 RepID=UPI00191D03A5|nr:AraC family transcriptional regulator [Klebsiella oxytoca]MBL0805318.1 AraC family transcriptional regulator [Klebsiella oxytoca]HEJ8502607.1 AraC family transcriptional regulator [Klebsiella oxytoca]